MAKNYMIGNWKMNQTLPQIKDFFSQLKSEIKVENNQNNFWIAPQTVQIPYTIELGSVSGILIGAQNCSDQDHGAYTGENSAASLLEIGCHFSLIGHSERRSYYAETDDFINKKVLKAIATGLVPVLCIGETLSEREANQTSEIVLGQLKNGLKNVELNNESEIIIAYEPVWAIGTGKTATPEQAASVHDEIRDTLSKLYGEVGLDISILYGGSVKPENVKDLLAKNNINGGLVGGASLSAESFAKLCNACSI